MIERFIVVSVSGDCSMRFHTLEEAQAVEKQAGNLVAGIIRVVVENGKIKHCHEVGSVEP